MEILAVLVAAVAAYAWGAAWYMMMAKPWMEAAGLTPEDVARRDPKPFVIAFLMTVLVAGMTRHILAASGLEGPVGGLMVGAGLGLFIACPWIVTNYAFARRPFALSLIDGTYAAGGCILIGVVLGLF